MNLAINEALLPRPILFEYYKELPTPKQHAALLLRDFREVFFGGQVGGGKSEWLIQDFLQYVDIPNYAGIILRKSYTDLAMPSALIDRSFKILSKDPRMHWNGDQKRWTFPSGASLTFGHMSHDKDMEKYASAEFQFVGFDEASQLYSNQILFFFSRLRKTSKMAVPLRMRLASNPGGPSHSFLKERYVDLNGPTYENGGRIFIPSGLRDNQHLNQDEYIQGLMHLDPITRKRLLEGDWDIAAATGIFNRTWFKVVGWFEVPPLKYYIRSWDLASTAPNQANKDPDYTATVKLGYDERTKIIYILDFQRWKLTPHESEMRMKEVVKADGLRTTHFIELEPGSAGKALLSHLQRNVLFGYHVKGIKPTHSKLVRAQPASSAAESGLIYVVEHPEYDAFFSELELFPTKGVHDDWVDAFSLAFDMMARPKKLMIV